MYDFIYACIFYVVPRKAVLGRSQSAASLYSVCLSFIGLAMFFWIIVYVLNLPISSRLLLFIIITIFGGIFYLNRVYFLRFSKQRMLLKKYNEWKKWKMKIVGIFFLISSFAFFVISGIFISIK